MRPRALNLLALGLVAAGDSGLAAEAPRSNLQSVGEVAAAERRSPAIGLVTSRAPDVLREQLGLERGAGLVVEAVAIGSPAERAGLKRNDVLVSLDEQLLVLPEQLAALVSASRPDAPLVIEVRRGGKSLQASLAALPAAPLVPAVAAPVVPPTTPTMTEATPSPSKAEAPKASQPAALPAAEEAVPIAAASGPPQPGPVADPPAAPVDFVPPPGARRLGPNAVVLDGRDYWLKVYRDSETCLMVRDARGWLLFNGPIATPKQRSLIPRRVRDRVIQLETMLDAVAVRSDAPATPARPAASGPQRQPAPATPNVAAAPPATAPATPPAREVAADPVAEIGALDVAPIEIR